MGTFKRLPDAEFEVMRVVWRNTPPSITTKQIIANIDSGNNWKPQTILTMLIRLIEKGFLRSEKIGKERSYIPIISEQDYLQSETGNFMKRYYGNSLGSFVKTLYDGQNLSEGDIRELKEWLSGKG